MNLEKQAAKLWRRAYVTRLALKTPGESTTGVAQMAIEAANDAVAGFRKAFQSDGGEFSLSEAEYAEVKATAAKQMERLQQAMEQVRTLI